MLLASHAFCCSLAVGLLALHGQLRLGIHIDISVFYKKNLDRTFPDQKTFGFQPHPTCLLASSLGGCVWSGFPITASLDMHGYVQDVASWTLFR